MYKLSALYIGYRDVMQYFLLRPCLRNALNLYNDFVWKLGILEVFESYVIQQKFIPMPMENYRGDTSIAKCNFENPFRNYTWFEGCDRFIDFKLH